MSFGFSVGDFLVVTQLVFRVIQNSKKACGKYNALTREVASLHVVLRRVEAERSKPDSVINQESSIYGQDLQNIVQDIHEIVKVLDTMLTKYNSLSEEKKRVTKLWQKIKFGNGEVQDLRDIMQQLSSLKSGILLIFNLALLGSQGRMEERMINHGTITSEIRETVNLFVASKAIGQKDGTVLTSRTNDDSRVWKELRRELIAEGFTSDVISDNKQLIKAYIAELGDRGALDEPDSERDDDHEQYEPLPQQDQGDITEATDVKDDGEVGLTGENEVSCDVNGEEEVLVGQESVHSGRRNHQIANDTGEEEHGGEGEKEGEKEGEEEEFFVYSEVAAKDFSNNEDLIRQGSNPAETIPDSGRENTEFIKSEGQKGQHDQKIAIDEQKAECTIPSRPGTEDRQPLESIQARAETRRKMMAFYRPSSAELFDINTELPGNPSPILPNIALARKSEKRTRQEHKRKPKPKSKPWSILPSKAHKKSRTPRTSKPNLVAPKVQPTVLSMTNYLRSDTKAPCRCIACLVVTPLDRMSSRFRCRHRMCHRCVRRLFGLSLRDFDFMPPRCCPNTPIPRSLVSDAFTDEFKRQWNQRYIESKNLFYCANSACGTWLDLSSRVNEQFGRQYGYCRSCTTKTCAVCKCEWHGQDRCKIDDDTKRMLAVAEEERRKARYLSQTPDIEAEDSDTGMTGESESSDKEVEQAQESRKIKVSYVANKNLTLRPSSQRKARKYI